MDRARGITVVGNTWIRAEDAFQTSALYGKSLAAGDFDNDGIDDLAVGLPGKSYEELDLSLIYQAGAVEVMFGVDDVGLDTNNRQMVHQNVHQIFHYPLGTGEWGDGFGTTLLADDFNGDGADDLVVGAPWEDIWTENADGSYRDISAKGMIAYVPGEKGSKKLDLEESEVWTIDDVLGAEITYGHHHPRIPQAVLFGASLASGDFNRDGKPDLAISAPGFNYGYVLFLKGTNGGLAVDPSINTLSGRNTYEYFGAAIAAGDFDGNGHDDLAVGAPYREFTGYSTVEAGGVDVVYNYSGTDFGATNYSSIDQISLSDGWIQDGDLFGASLSSGDFNRSGMADLAITVPGDYGIRSGFDAIHVLYGQESLGLHDWASDFFYWDTPMPAPHDPPKIVRVDPPQPPPPTGPSDWEYDLLDLSESGGSVFDKDDALDQFALQTDKSETDTAEVALDPAAIDSVFQFRGG